MTSNIPRHGLEQTSCRESFDIIHHGFTFAEMQISMSDEAGSKWEKSTWPELARLAKDVPEAGIHFQGR